jgi:hypothetical protein
LLKLKRRKKCQTRMCWNARGQETRNGQYRKKWGQDKCWAVLTGWLKTGSGFHSGYQWERESRTFMRTGLKVLTCIQSPVLTFSKIQCLNKAVLTCSYILERTMICENRLWKSMVWNSVRTANPENRLLGFL